LVAMEPPYFCPLVDEFSTKQKAKTHSFSTPNF
jgi:hypothetical protein